jgi:hypothetical protein
MEPFHRSQTPKHGSWLNQAEIEISLFARQCLARRRLPTLAKLQLEAGAWNARVNHDRVKINWQFTRKKARQKFGYKPSKTTDSCGQRPRSSPIKRCQEGYWLRKGRHRTSASTIE